MSTNGDCQHILMGMRKCILQLSGLIVMRSKATPVPVGVNTLDHNVLQMVLDPAHVKQKMNFKEQTSQNECRLHRQYLVGHGIEVEIAIVPSPIEQELRVFEFHSLAEASTASHDNQFLDMSLTSLTNAATIPITLEAMATERNQRTGSMGKLDDQIRDPVINIQGMIEVNIVLDNETGYSDVWGKVTKPGTISRANEQTVVLITQQKEGCGDQHHQYYSHFGNNSELGTMKADSPCYHHAMEPSSIHASPKRHSGTSCNRKYFESGINVKPETCHWAQMLRRYLKHYPVQVLFIFLAKGFTTFVGEAEGCNDNHAPHKRMFPNAASEEFSIAARRELITAFFHCLPSFTFILADEELGEFLDCRDLRKFQKPQFPAISTVLWDWDLATGLGD
ncbi:uncharacterized protein EV420DRAFT_1682820 [Desarmillaria tabescens]|uniref:Uncharacterized protein n=1 Tax=Armillaria tabescens TaxID=1929756 RepID=A0AA39MHH8_ARMTA|nr:uncharacterized protein EV420DRAFT_1682820 [Desarmillaria tabescens]KAK0434522.1 hypothetical protein EV420DRAFT_1682820 [Desarmillaria tabescens]